MKEQQQPLGSGFGPESTANDVLSGIRLDGKVVIVTGGYSGIGLETTRSLSAAGACVIVPVRTIDKANDSLRGMAGVEQKSLDLLDPKSIDKFVNWFMDTGRPLDLLINGAGVMAAPLMRDARGYESQFSVNHLGHFQFTAGLWPALKRAGVARVVSVSSRGHHFGDIDFRDPNFTAREYDKWKAYGQSKTANVLFAMQLDTFARSHGVSAFSVHPGRVMSTDLIRHLSDSDLRAAGVLDENGQRTAAAMGKSIEQGAATTVWCATSPQLNGLGGLYCEDVDVAVPTPEHANGKFGVQAWAVDPINAEKLWSLSESLTGVKFDCR